MLLSECIKWEFIIAPNDPRMFRTVYPDGAYHMPTYL